MSPKASDISSEVTLNEKIDELAPYHFRVGYVGGWNP